MKNARLTLICDWQVSFKEYVMTPSWLKTHASYIDSNHSITTDQLAFSEGPKKDAALLKVLLVAADVLEDGTPLTVVMTVANDISIGQMADSDIRYGVSDGTSFIGFETTDMECYDRLTPSYGAERNSTYAMYFFWIPCSFIHVKIIYSYTRHYLKI